LSLSKQFTYQWKVLWRESEKEEIVYSWKNLKKRNQHLTSTPPKRRLGAGMPPNVLIL
jgi:hypothetical protein